MDVGDEGFLRRAIELAQQARTRGADPFGALLVVNNAILQEAMDESVASSDPTWHAELSVISMYCRTHQRFALDGYTLYTSTEPCAMCAGAVHWAHISRVVFSVSQAMLQNLSGGNPKVGCGDILNSGRRVEIVGPLLPSEGLAVFDGYQFVPKVERHRLQQFNKR